MEQESLLADLEFRPVLATTGQRFVNYIIDGIFFYLVIVALAWAFIIGSDARFYSTSDGSFTDQLIFRIAGLLVYAFMYFLLELGLKGRSIGKLVTGTKAVNEDGSDMSTQTLLIRSLSRAVPFEQFSAFGARPWHDRWSHTYVIDVKKTNANDLNQL